MKRVALGLAILLGSLVAVGSVQAAYPYHNHSHHHHNNYYRGNYGGYYGGYNTPHVHAYRAPYGAYPYGTYYRGGYGGGYSGGYCAPGAVYPGRAGVSFYYGY